MPAEPLCVVIPAWNEERALARLLPRLLAGEKPDRADGVWVVDGGSDDRTAAVARDAGARVVASPPGRGVQLSRGAKAVHQQHPDALLLFLHADGYPSPGSLSALRRAFEGEALVACFRQRIEAQGRVYRWIEGAAAWRAGRGRIYGDSGLAMRSTLYQEVGGYRELPLFEDLELSKRLARRAPVSVLEGPLLVDARRWRREGALLCTLRNWMLRVGYEIGIPPERLVRLYPPHRRVVS